MVGDVIVGGEAPISIESMIKTDPHDLKDAVKQIRALERVGCEIVRIAVPDMEAALLLGEIKQKISIPIVADIHFNYRLALAAIEQGVAAVRLNPGNISKPEQIAAVVRAARGGKVSIRVGVNAGSLKARPPSAEAMVESASHYIKILEDLNFDRIIISLKASDVLMTVEAYRLMAERCNYPFHLGITAAGPPPAGSIRAALGLGILLSEGIGDTIRISLTGSPEEEVKTGHEILLSLNLRQGVKIISCPTCGRCQIDLEKIVRYVEKAVSRERSALSTRQLKVAIMGCVVNGPKEAGEADIGIAGGRGRGVLFRKGKRIKSVSEDELTRALLEEINSWKSSSKQ
jgi:(E)-4-hydroxy-3-methylbut-2-enyl-diphosphate synthase